MLTYADLSRLTGISQNTLRQWKKRGKLPPSGKVGATTVWEDTPELRAWIERNEDTNGRREQ